MKISTIYLYAKNNTRLDLFYKAQQCQWKSIHFATIRFYESHVHLHVSLMGTFMFGVGS